MAVQWERILNADWDDWEELLVIVCASWNILLLSKSEPLRKKDEKKNKRGGQKEAWMGGNRVLLLNYSLSHCLGCCLTYLLFEAFVISLFSWTKRRFNRNELEWLVSRISSSTISSAILCVTEMDWWWSSQDIMGINDCAVKIMINQWLQTALHLMMESDTRYSCNWFKKIPLFDRGRNTKYSNVTKKH